MQIGNLKIDGIVALAPMAGITNETYRRFMKPYGVALSYTEMISDFGLIYQNRETYTYLPTEKSDHPVALQLFGGSKDSLVAAVKILENSNLHYEILDINLGCPMPKVTKTGAGSSWLQRPDELYQAMKAVVEVSSRPVAAKIRLGWDEQNINYLEIIEQLQLAGVQLIALHARTRAQVYTGLAKYELIGDLQAKMHVPLIISGDIYSLDDAIKAQAITGAQMVMVARGGVGHPHLITEIDHYFRTGERLEPATLASQISAMEKYMELYVGVVGQECAIPQLRGILPKFLTGFANTKKYRVQITSSIKTVDDVYRIIAEMKTDNSAF